MSTFYGGTGNDTFAGAAENDSLYGGAGNDTLYGGAGSDSLYGGDGSDMVSGGTGNDALFGGTGADNLAGGTGRDTLYGDSGNDTLIGDGQILDLAQFKSTTGGTATTLTLVNAADGPIVLWSISTTGSYTKIATVAEGQSYSYATTTTTNFFLTDESNYFVDTITGGANQTFTYTPQGEDLLYGGSGDNVIVGQYGADTIYGDAGNDTINAGSGNDSVYGGDGNDSILGGTGNDFLSGDAGNDSLDGGTGNDSLDGGTGNDSLYGGTGNDALYGGTGNDRLEGQAGDDTLYGGENDDLLYGGDGNDVLYGDTGSNLLSGDAGNDLLYGGTGSDTLLGGTGNDALYGGIGNDSLDGQAGDDTLYGGAGDDRLYGGDGNDAVYGDTGSNLIYGGTGNDALYGGSGSDSLVGGAGNDLLAGGSGNDRFALSDGSGTDTISDFDMTLTSGVTADQLDVSMLHNPDLTAVKVWNVQVLDNGSGQARLLFPNGESVVLQGVSPATAQQAGVLHAMGVPCFVQGARIATPQGPRRVEDIRAGDRVLTAQGRAEPVLWHGVRRLGRNDLQRQPNLRPILLGAVTGQNPLWVSPQHAVYVPQFGALVRACHLAEFAIGPASSSQERVWPDRSVVYHHLLLPQHELLEAEGHICESFYPGRMALQALSPTCRNAVQVIVSSLARSIGRSISGDMVAQYGPRCLPLMSRRELLAALAHGESGISSGYPTARPLISNAAGRDSLQPNGR